MADEYILAIDQGTTGSRAFIFDKKGKVVAKAYKEFPQYFPQPGWVEHDAEEIYTSCVSVINAVIKQSRVNPKQIKSIGITNQRETTVLWDRRSAKPVAKAIVWQCRRTRDICQSLKKRKLQPVFRRKTGLVLDPYFSGTKVKWLLDHHKSLRAKARRGELCFGTIDSWLIFKLTGGKSHVTDYTNASRTLLFNIRTKKWDAELCRLLRVPQNILPTVQASGSVFGETAGGSRLPPCIPITAVLGDQQAALFGQGCFNAGSMKNTYGTGCFVVANTGQKFISSKKGMLTTLAADADGKPVYALEGAIFIAGAAVQWLRDQLKVIKDSSETERRIAGLKDTHGVYFVPAFAGLGAPYWDVDARGVICGLTRGANSNHIIRAALESMAYQTKDVVDIMRKEAGRVQSQLKVDGGACQNDFLMQFQADMLNARIIRPKMIDSTIFGAALLAGRVSGIWSSRKALEALMKTDKTFQPKMSPSQRKELYAGWKRAVQRALTK